MTNKLEYFGSIQEALFWISEVALNSTAGQSAKFIHDLAVLIPYLGFRGNPIQSEADIAFLNAARDEFGSDGDLDFDDYAIVSISEDGGAYVSGWKWISNEQAGICNRCGEANANNGEGYDGLCGRCADHDEDMAEWLGRVLAGETTQGFEEWRAAI